MFERFRDGRRSADHAVCHLLQPLAFEISLHAGDAQRVSNLSFSVEDWRRDAAQAKHDLAIVNPQTSRSVVVLSPEGDDPDSQVIKTVLLASMQGYAPQVAIEFGRKVLFSTERPSFVELEAHVKKK